jgi:hypothetical protein
MNNDEVPGNYSTFWDEDKPPTDQPLRFTVLFSLFLGAFYQCSICWIKCFFNIS